MNNYQYNDDPDICIRCGCTLRDYEDFPPIPIPGKGEICSDCYNQLTEVERKIFFMGV